MPHSRILFVLLLITLIVTNENEGTVIESHYEESLSYSQNPQCKPSILDKGIQCTDVGPAFEVQGGLYSNFGLYHVPLASAYYIARFADACAWGYQSRCPTNTTFLRRLNMQSPWSGAEESTAVDGACGYDVLIREKCKFPNDGHPFICTGIEGTPGTYGRRLGMLSYISILQGANLRWTLFANCWKAGTPENPQSEDIATSFNVFSLDPTLNVTDRTLIISELQKRGFSTDPSNLIEFDYTTTGCD